jgi:signal transduction histidine kinase
MGSGNGGGGRMHRVEFFEDPALQASSVAAHLAEALRAGGTAGAIARPALLDAVRDRLVVLGIDVLAALARHQLVLLEADEQLASIMIGAMPDRARFLAAVEPMLHGLASRGQPVHLYGEMVDVLSECGQAEAAVRLEQLWNELGREYSFHVLCGYRVANLPRDVECLEQICGEHQGVERDTAQALTQLAERARALQLEVERRSRTEQRMHGLLAVTTELAAATDAQTISALVVEAGRAAVGAVSSGLWTLSVSGVDLELVCASQSSEQDARRFERVPLDGDTPAAYVMRTGEAVFLASLAEYEATFPSSFQRMAQLRGAYRAIAVVPLQANGTTLGVMAYSYPSDHTFEDSERTFQKLLARQCALALDRVRMHREEREARLLADEATRAREEILSVVSHDLRNPLGAILMCTSALLHMTADDSTGRVHTNLARIHRQAERMARYISDLVDFAGIEAGRITLERREHQPEEIVSAASEMFGPIAAERGLRLETRMLPNLPAVECDSDRAVQVLTNLVANAVKVTPKGGAVSIGAEVNEDGVIFFVRDTGPGIDADEMPNLFERHWRSKSSNYKGAGLGLSIARGIVSAHGGRIWAESRVGAGSTFYFSLTHRQTN